MKKGQDGNKISFRDAVRNNIYILKLAYKICPGRVILSFALNFIMYMVNYFYSVVFISLIFQTIAGELPFQTITILVVVSGVVLLLVNLATNFYYHKYMQDTDLLFQEKLNLMVFEKAADVELECYENTEFYNRYTRAGTEANQRIINMLNNLSRLFGLGASAVMIIITIVALDPLAVCFIVFPLIFRFVIDVRANKVRYELDRANTPYNRVKGYVNRILYLEQYAKEIRMTHIFNLLKKNYQQGVEGLTENYKTHGKKVAKYRALQDGIERIMRYPLMVTYAAANVLVFHRIPVASLVVLINVISNLLHAFTDLTQFFTGLQADGLYIQNFKEFMEYEPKIAQSQDGLEPKETENVLVLDHVSYSYTGADRPVLQDISLSVKKGEKIALVGSNGAGKTTLVKLIMRLYDVTEGEILLDGENIKAYNVEQYRALYGTIFQDFKMFSMSVGENVLMRRMADTERELVSQALKDAGIYDKIMENEKGLSQILTREFAEDGVVLSGGEFQKLAIARVFAKPCKIAILDEPSSALDPIAEYNVFESMKRVCRDKAVIFISHRLSTAILADRIYMLENGRIIESGSHEALMEKQGKYADMFRKQSQMYLGGGFI